MNSQTRTPFFEFSYDPPSPDVPSEYDPPFPLEVVTPQLRASIDFSSGELAGDSLANNDNDNDRSGGHVTLEEKVLSEEVAFIDEGVSSCKTTFRESNGCCCEEEVWGNIDEVFDVASKRVRRQSLRLTEKSGLTGQIGDDALFDVNDAENEENGRICVKQRKNKTSEGAAVLALVQKGVESVLIQKSTIPSFSPDEQVVTEISREGGHISLRCEVSIGNPSTQINSPLNGDTERKATRKSPHSASGLSEDVMLPTSHSNDSARRCAVANVVRSDVSRSENSETGNAYSAPLPCKEAHPTAEENPRTSASSTNQSESSVIEISTCSSLPFDKATALGANTRSLVALDKLSEEPPSAQDPTKNRRVFSSSLECNDDSLMRSPSPAYSLFLTESCSITPFPTDYTTPYSTNPTSTPLPSPIPSEVFSNLTSESSPSTPSTITSSAMLCVSRKLESLANGVTASSSNSISKEDGCGRSDLDLGFNNNRLRRELREDLSPNFSVPSNLGNNNENSLQNSRQLMALGNNRVSNSPPLEKQNYEKKIITAKVNLFSANAFQISNNSDNESSTAHVDRSKQAGNSAKMRQSQVHDIQSTEEAKSNIIYCYNPVMEKSSVVQQKERFAGPESTNTDQKISKRKLVSKCLSSSSFQTPEDTKNHICQESAEERKTDDSFQRSKTNEFSSSETKSFKISSPPPPPPRLGSSHMVIPPPLPPPPADDDIEDDADLPPIPALPQETKYVYSNEREASVSPPVPPVRQYLLLPLFPGLAMPILLTPPPTPQRSSSYHKSSPPPRPSPPSLSPPPAPPPRQFLPFVRKDKDLHEEGEEERELCPAERLLNGLFGESDTVPPKNGVGTRYLALGRELTPVPEEKASSASHSPSPDGEEEASDHNLPSYSPTPKERKIPSTDDLVPGKKSVENGVGNETCHLKHYLPLPLLPSTPDNQTFINRSSSCYPASLTENTAPPPLPPRLNGLKISPSLKPPPPPPPSFPTVSPPPPPKRLLGPLLGTGTSPSSASSPSVVLPGLRPYRLIDRSPPNDRDFSVFPADADTPELPKQLLQKSSSPPPSTVAPDQLDLPVAPPPMPPGGSPSGGMKSSCMSVSSYGRLVIDRSDLPLPTPDEEIRKVHATVKRWRWISGYRDTLAIYTQFRPIIQQGPQCGLVALSMASYACQKSVSVEELLQKARTKGVSYHGEMFSARAMAELASEMLKGVSASVRSGVLESPSEVIKVLLEGDFILFPYDSEPNHFPGLHKGMKSHWGLLCGCLVQSSGLEILRRQDFSIVRSDPQIDFLWHLRPLTRVLDEDQRPSSVPLACIPEEVAERGSRSVSPYSLSGDRAPTTTVKAKKQPARMILSNEFGKKDWCKASNISSLVVLYRQGKSRNLIYTPLADLSYSNQQLLEYPPTEDYVIGSVEEGLSKQVVILHKEKPGLSDLLGLIQEKEINQ